MNSFPFISESLKKIWPERRSELIALYCSGDVDSIELTKLLSQAMDSFLKKLVHFLLEDCSEQVRNEIENQVTILAVGGYGRAEMFPFSDVDLLITYERPLTEVAHEFASGFVRCCWDAGLKLGHATRSISQTVSLLRDEAHVATGLIETRLIWGNDTTHQKLRSRFIGWLKKSSRLFLDACEEARNVEIQESASAVYSLEPNVKKSPGTLRDLHVIRWIGFSKYETSSFNGLVEKKALPKSVASSLYQAQEFLSTIRVELHIEADRAQEILSLQEQLRLTDQKGLTDLVGQRAVERFMQQYYLNADLISKTMKRFVDFNRTSTFQERVSSRIYRKIVDQKYLIAGKKLNVPSYELKTITESLKTILQAFLVASRHHVRLSSRLIEGIQRQIPNLERVATSEEKALFLELLSQYGFLGPTLRDLLECGVLELLIPQFTHSRGLLQFNHYHAYTVDEHTLRTLEALDRHFQNPGPLSKNLSALKNKPLLPLALLLHDLGKGFEEDHSILGAQIAKNVSERFGLEKDATRQLVLLVREHLSMSLLAFRRDTSDPVVVAGFSRLVGDVDTLRKLYLLTICDIQAVAPDIWDDWKERLLEELFERSMLALQGQYARTDIDLKLTEIREEVLNVCAENGLSPELLKQGKHELSEIPGHYLFSASVAQIARDLQIALNLKLDEVQISHSYNEETNSIELTIVTRQSGVERCFHRLTGVLTALRISILSADICTSPTGLIFDRFIVKDQDFACEPPPERWKKISESLSEAVSRPVSFERLFQKHRRFGSGTQVEPISDQQSYVSIDNTTSEVATIIDVFAHDLPGLLFTLSKALYDLDLSVTLARITTHVDQVVDVFYVTTLDGEPIKDDVTCKAIRDRLEYVLSEFERFGYRLFSI